MLLLIYILSIILAMPLTLNLEINVDRDEPEFGGRYR